MHPEILDEQQEKILPLLAKFAGKFYLVGGTAIALHIGHRRSIDFDLFSPEEFVNSKLRAEIKKQGSIEAVIRDEKGEYTVVSQGMKLTFLYYPFIVSADEKFGALPMPDLLSLSAMKAYALGRRVKWKDYVDLYFVLKDYHNLAEIVDRAKQIFGSEFNEKTFREQLCYYEDIDYSESVDFLPGFETEDEEVKNFLKNCSLV